VRSHAKASSAGSIEGTGNSRGLLRRAFAIRGASRGSRGSGAPALKSLLVLALAVASLLAVVAPASAAYLNPTNFSGPGSGPGQIASPGRAAVEQSTANLFAVDTATGRVEVFKPNGSGGVDYLTQFGEGQLSAPWGIAIDEDAGQTYVYVADAGNDRILKYASDEAATPTFTIDGSFTSPALGTGVGEIGDFKAALAVDPTTHELLVADRSRKLIERFGSTGAPVSEFDGSAGEGSFGPFSGPVDIAVNSEGDIYLIDATGEIEFNEGYSLALRYSASGAYKAMLLPVGETQSPGTIAVRPDSDEVAVSGEQDSGYNAFGSLNLYLFDSDNQPLDTVFVPGGELHATFGLAFGSGSSARLYVLHEGVAPRPSEGGPWIPGVGYVAFTYFVPPIVTLDPPAITNGVEAHFAGTVDPNGSATDYRFEIAVDDGSPDWSSFALGKADGSSPVAVTANKVLEAEGKYLVRIVASNPAGEVISVEQPVAATAGQPTVQAIAGSGRTTSGARLNATINSNGLPTTYRFEWGTTTGYGNVIPVSGPDSYGGQGTTPVRYSKPISGLAPGITIHYRVIAQNADGISVSGDRTVVTLSEEIAYEMVSPPDKEGANLLICCGLAASPSGDRAVYFSGGTFSGGQSSLVVNPYLSWRGTDNWRTQAVGPRLTASEFLITYTGGLSPDLSHALMLSTDALAPGAIAGKTNLYRENLLTKEFETVAQLSKSEAMFLSEQNFFMGSSTDGSYMVFKSPQALTPDAIQGEPAETGDRSKPSNIYGYGNGELELLSYLPNGEATTVYPLSGTANRIERNMVPKDASRVFFLAGETDSRALYVREDDETTLISASHRPGDDPVIPRPVVFGTTWASADGSTVYFASAEPLTSDSPALSEADAPGSNQVWNLYRYQVDSGELTYIAPEGGGEVGSVNGVSEDGSIVYFSNKAGMRLYVAEDGVSRRIEGVSGGAGLVTPSGRYALVNPEASSCLPNCDQSYVYDAVDDSFSCATCNPDGGPTSPTGIEAQTMENSGNYVSRALLDNGQAFFDSRDRLVPEDTNDTVDVYRWDDGQLDLVSWGKGSGDAKFTDVTPDGRSVFFFTGDRLVGQDVDSTYDVYAARIGGGLPAQNPPQPDAPCFGEGCLGPTPQPPGEVSPGSNGFNGPRNAKPTANQRGAKKCGKGRKMKKAHGRAKCVKRATGKSRGAGK
jgi:hypothetical protein